MRRRAAMLGLRTDEAARLDATIAVNVRGLGYGR